MLDPKVISQKYFNSVTYEEIEKKLSFLMDTLPRKCTRRNYQLSKNILKISSTANKNNLQSKLQEIADKMREHLLIKRYIKIITISNVDAGKFERIGDLNCIYVNGDFSNQNFQQKIAILAHEMSHFYLIYQHKIYFPDTNENELLTELNAIYIGFGLLLLEGYETFEKRTGNKILKSRAGYINNQTIRTTIIRTAYLRKQNPIWILKNIGIGNIIYFTIKLFGLIKDYFKTKKRGRKT